MFNFFKKDKKTQLRKKYEKAMEEAMHVQRSGDLKLYAKKMAAAEELAKEIAQMEGK